MGAPGPPDDADVAIGARITNVMKASDNSDYTGELRLELPLRITDAFNPRAPRATGSAPSATRASSPRFRARGPRTRRSARPAPCRRPRTRCCPGRCARARGRRNSARSPPRRRVRRGRRHRRRQRALRGPGHLRALRACGRPTPPAGPEPGNGARRRPCLSQCSSSSLPESCRAWPQSRPVGFHPLKRPAVERELVELLVGELPQGAEAAVRRLQDARGDSASPAPPSARAFSSRSSAALVFSLAIWVPSSAGAGAGGSQQPLFSGAITRNGAGQSRKSRVLGLSPRRSAPLRRAPSRRLPVPTGAGAREAPWRRARPS